jgi:hypothetical protein
MSRRWSRIHSVNEGVGMSIWPKVLHLWTRAGAAQVNGCDSAYGSYAGMLEGR